MQTSQKPGDNRRVTLTDLRRPLVLGLAALFAWLLYELWSGAYFVYFQPLLAAPLLALLVILLAGGREAPWLAYAFWLAGALTLVWSLAPGNTLIYLLWELSFVGALVLGIRFPWLFWPLALVLLLYNLQAALSLNLFDLQKYLSGSVHYVAGAQALALLPLAVAGFLRGATGWRAVGWLLLAFVTLYLALISGARAVYLPLAIGMVILLGRSLWAGVSWMRVLITVVLLAGLVLGLDHVFPNQPLATALGTKATVEAQTGAVSDQGGFSNRLRLWDQAMAIALDNPQGAGVGSYPAVIHAYQKYPMTWSSSAHNYFIEVLSGGGWLKLTLLLALLVPAFLLVWLSPSWPWAIAAGGFWMTLAVDVTSYYPGVMMFAFLLVGVLYGRLRIDAVHIPAALAAPRLTFSLWLATLLLGAGMTAWWFVPCSGAPCATQRYLGIDYKVLPALEEATPSQRVLLLERASELYPASQWVLRARQRYVASPEDELALAREFAIRFPYQHPDNYLLWAQAALAAGRPGEALEAIEAGLAVFPADRYPYGEQRMTRERYAQWIDQADALQDLARRSLIEEDEGTPRQGE